jgi:hypothetical protein
MMLTLSVSSRYRDGGELFGTVRNGRRSAKPPPTRRPAQSSRRLRETLTFPHAVDAGLTDA